MDYLTHELISKITAKKIIKEILENKSLWKDGKLTAGSHASANKENFQLEKKSKVSERNSYLIKDLITSDVLIKSFAIPKKIHGTMFTKTQAGQGYGKHIDNPYMRSGRSDLSFTLFLSEPEDYEGGELCIHNISNSEDIKLEAGEIIIYPSTSIHSVKKVTHGTRVVCVGWIESYISNNDQRRFLFGLDAGAKGLLARHGRSDELDLIFQAYSNLIRSIGN